MNLGYPPVLPHINGTRGDPLLRQFLHVCFYFPMSGHAVKYPTDLLEFFYSINQHFHPNSNKDS